MEKIWLDQYQQGVPHQIDTHVYSSLTALFDDSFVKFSQNPAYENMGTVITYQDLEEKSRHFAAYLQQLGVVKGARVSIMMPNILQYPIALCGVLRAGLVVVNTNPLYTMDEFIHQTKDAESEVVVVLANFAHIVLRARSYLPNLKHIIVTELGDAFPKVKRILVNAFVQYIKRMVPDYAHMQHIKFNDAMANGASSSFSPVTLKHDDTAFLQYTGGTTGVLKAAKLSHKNIVANLLQASAWISPVINGGHDIVVTALPMYHIFSLTANCLTFMKIGAKNILITNPRDTRRFINEIKNIEFTAFTGVNTLFNSLLNHPHFKKINFSKLKLALSGGMALQKSVALQWRQATNAPILEAYGLTEASPAISINPLFIKEYNGSVGLPLPSTDVSIRNEQGEEVPLGETGELCVSGPQVMTEYWQRPDETKQVFWADGFLRTGDGARMDGLGYIHLVDRIKDMILVSGFNVYPNEVEQVISQLPKVLEVGVIGVRKPSGGEDVKACIVKRISSLTEEEVIEHCQQHLTAYKIPKIIEFYSDLPKSNVGKVLRRSLK